jgi:hypothetical protein
MKIAVVSQLRSRSNYLATSLSNFNGLIHAGDPYRDLYELLNSRDRLDKFAELSKNITSTLNAIDGGYLVKIQLSNMPGTFTTVPMLPDVNVFNFKSYDKIYITYRKNMVEQICSLIVATETGNFVTNKSSPFIPFNSFTFDLNKHIDLVNSVALDHLKLRLLIHYFKKQSIPYTLIEYKDSVKWVNTNLPATRAGNIATRYEYPRIFFNYNDVVDFVDAYTGSIL